MQTTMRPEPVNCDRCGRVLGNQSAYANHKRVCSILPPGMELVEEFREDHDLTITSMAESHYHKADSWGRKSRRKNQAWLTR